VHERRRRFRYCDENLNEIAKRECEYLRAILQPQQWMAQRSRSRKLTACLWSNAWTKIGF
jgi:hypothetical protein